MFSKNPIYGLDAFFMSFVSHTSKTASFKCVYASSSTNHKLKIHKPPRSQWFDELKIESRWPWGNQTPTTATSPCTYSPNLQLKMIRSITPNYTVRETFKKITQPKLNLVFFTERLRGSDVFVCNRKPHVYTHVFIELAKNKGNLSTANKSAPVKNTKTESRHVL